MWLRKESEKIKTKTELGKKKKEKKRKNKKKKSIYSQKLWENTLMSGQRQMNTALSHTSSRMCNLPVKMWTQL